MGKVFFELPGGFAKPGETPEHAARRELLEEVVREGTREQRQAVGAQLRILGVDALALGDELAVLDLLQVPQIGIVAVRASDGEDR